MPLQNNELLGNSTDSSKGLEVICEEQHFIDNPDPRIGRIAITADQLRALHRKYELSADGAPSFEEFEYRARPGGIGSDRFLVLPWCGMWLAIETDGHTHS